MIIIGATWVIAPNFKVLGKVQQSKKKKHILISRF
jgi:hypothetical protein